MVLSLLAAMTVLSDYSSSFMTCAAISGFETKNLEIKAISFLRAVIWSCFGFSLLWAEASGELDFDLGWTAVYRRAETHCIGWGKIPKLAPPFVYSLISRHVSTLFSDRTVIFSMVAVCVCWDQVFLTGIFGNSYALIADGIESVV